MEKIDEFKGLIEDFVADNFHAEGCRECHEVGHGIMPEGTIKEYDEASRKLLSDIMELITRWVEE